MIELSAKKYLKLKASIEKAPIGYNLDQEREMALIDSMNFEQLLRFEDRHSVSVGPGSAAVPAASRKTAVRRALLARATKRRYKASAARMAKFVAQKRRARA